MASHISVYKKYRYDTLHRHHFLLLDLLESATGNYIRCVTDIWTPMGACVIVHTAFGVCSSAVSRALSFPCSLTVSVSDSSEKVVSLFTVLEVVFAVAPGRRSRIGKHEEKKRVNRRV